MLRMTKKCNLNFVCASVDLKTRKTAMTSLHQSKTGSGDFNYEYMAIKDSVGYKGSFCEWKAY